MGQLTCDTREEYDKITLNRGFKADVLIDKHK